MEAPFKVSKTREGILRIEDPIAVLKYVDDLPMKEQVALFRKHVKCHGIKDPCIDCWIHSNAPKMYLDGGVLNEAVLSQEDLNSILE